MRLWGGISFILSVFYVIFCLLIYVCLCVIFSCVGGLVGMSDTVCVTRTLYISERVVKDWREGTIIVLHVLPYHLEYQFLNVLFRG